ncbi:hypothetical protein A2773_06640 [Candidatus Gottesmanbacteria bacterium RIFCSPHIGHO2_01_FULL_39_10]|uniref:Uncharacterized protein n=1 Tax=Candidatus Gottesmanbacteria bacterium RIFCSPHIGHO2_01_FULL_39_10 TaxID=1798375 RepID=A0A1F5ZQ78_9BACT|nr:MAG: hypothetical protein A2773_06640 [Candidatus Gottesmanbacteria bacterium RIFCSPHIGHO2_01_FULL_39_10]
MWDGAGLPDLPGQQLNFTPENLLAVRQKMSVSTPTVVEGRVVQGGAGVNLLLDPESKIAWRILQTSPDRGGVVDRVRDNPAILAMLQATGNSVFDTAVKVKNFAEADTSQSGKTTFHPVGTEGANLLPVVGVELIRPEDGWTKIGNQAQLYDDKKGFTCLEMGRENYALGQSVVLEVKNRIRFFRQILDFQSALAENGYFLHDYKGSFGMKFNPDGLLERVKILDIDDLRKINTSAIWKDIPHYIAVGNQMQILVTNTSVPRLLSALEKRSDLAQLKEIKELLYLYMHSQIAVASAGDQKRAGLSDRAMNLQQMTEAARKADTFGLDEEIKDFSIDQLKMVLQKLKEGVENAPIANLNATDKNGSIPKGSERATINPDGIKKIFMGAYGADVRTAARIGGLFILEKSDDVLELIKTHELKVPVVLKYLIENYSPEIHGGLLLDMADDIYHSNRGIQPLLYDILLVCSQPWFETPLYNSANVANLQSFSKLLVKKFDDAPAFFRDLAEAYSSISVLDKYGLLPNARSVEKAQLLFQEEPVKIAQREDIAAEPKSSETIAEEGHAETRPAIDPRQLSNAWQISADRQEMPASMRWEGHGSFIREGLIDLYRVPQEILDAKELLNADICNSLSESRNLPEPLDWFARIGSNQMSKEFEMVYDIGRKIYKDYLDLWGSSYDQWQVHGMLDPFEDLFLITSQRFFDEPIYTQGNVNRLASFAKALQDADIKNLPQFLVDLGQSSDVNEVLRQYEYTVKA